MVRLKMQGGSLEIKQAFDTIVNFFIEIERPQTHTCGNQFGKKYVVYTRTTIEFPNKNLICTAAKKPEKTGVFELT